MDERYYARRLAASMLFCVITGHIQVVGARAQVPSTQSVVAVSDWKKNLKIGPNGPIPVIVVDQFGYPTKSRKVAVVRAPQIGYDSFLTVSPGKSYALVELTTGKVVKTAPLTAWS